MVAQKDAVNFLAQSPEDRLHVIRDTSPDIIACLVCLADVYSKSGKYPQAAAYYKKALQCLYELYGDGAVVFEAGVMLNNLGINYKKSGEYSKADECYDQALAIKAELQPDSLDHASTLYNQGLLHHKHLNDSKKAESLYREALTIYTKLDPSNQIIQTIRAKLSELASEPTITSSTKSGHGGILCTAHHITRYWTFNNEDGWYVNHIYVYIYPLLFALSYLHSPLST